MMSTLKNESNQIGDIKFSVTAPGKVILHGEHSVVYGHLAIAASLNLLTRVDFDQPRDVLVSPQSKAVQFVMPNINLDVSFPTSAIVREVLSSTQGDWDHENPNNVDFSSIVQNVQTFIDQQFHPKILPQGQKEALTTCLFLMAAILHQPKEQGCYTLKPFKLNASSELPVGAGAGSSASFSVCLATTFLYLAYLHLHPKDPFVMDSRVKTLISEWAFFAERIHHGTPSGIDNNICTYGSAIAFRRPNVISRISLSGMRILLVDTGVSRNTRKLVESVAELKNRHPDLVTNILQAMNSLSSEAVTLLEHMEEASKSNNVPKELEVFGKIQELWSINHSLLVALQLSHPSLEQIVKLAKQENFRAKLTGAGGGGFAIVLVPPSTAFSEPSLDVAVQRLRQLLESNDFSVRDVIIGGNGVQLHTQV